MLARSRRASIYHSLQMSSRFVSQSFRAILTLLIVTVTASADFVLVNGRIFTGTTDGVIEQGSVVVRGDQIESISTDRPEIADVEVIDATGMTIMPGLVDAGGVGIVRFCAWTSGRGRSRH